MSSMIKSRKVLILGMITAVFYIALNMYIRHSLGYADMLDIISGETFKEYKSIVLYIGCLFPFISFIILLEYYYQMGGSYMALIRTGDRTHWAGRLLITEAGLILIHVSFIFIAETLAYILTFCTVSLRIETLPVAIHMCLSCMTVGIMYMLGRMYMNTGNCIITIMSLILMVPLLIIVYFPRLGDLYVLNMLYAYGPKDLYIKLPESLAVLSFFGIIYIKKTKRADML